MKGKPGGLGRYGSEVNENLAASPYKEGHSDLPVQVIVHHILPIASSHR